MTTDILPRPLLDIEEAARILGTSERMIRRLIAEGKLRRVKVGRWVRIRPEDLERFMDINTSTGGTR